MDRSKSFNFWKKTINSKVDMKIIDQVFLTDLFYDAKMKILSFVIKHYHKEPKITKYVSSDLFKTPIYGDYSEKTTIIFEFNKIIDPVKFVNEEILALNLEKRFVLQIIDKIAVMPEWRKRELIIMNINNEIKSYQSFFRNFEQEKKSYNFKITDFQEYPSNFWLRFFFGFFTFFLSFLGFVSKDEAKQNKILNQKHKLWNQQHKIAIDQENQRLLAEITSFNQSLEQKLAVLKTQLLQVKATNSKINFIN